MGGRGGFRAGVGRAVVVGVVVAVGELDEKVRERRLELKIFFMMVVLRVLGWVNGVVLMVLRCN